MFFSTAAWAADTHAAAGHHEESLLSSPEFWVAVSFVLFVAITGKKIFQGLTKMLDDRSALIARTVGEAEALRHDGEDVLGADEAAIEQCQARDGHHQHEHR